MAATSLDDMSSVASPEKEMDETAPVIEGAVDGITLTGEVDGARVGIKVGAAVMKTSQKIKIP